VLDILPYNGDLESGIINEIREAHHQTFGKSFFLCDGGDAFKIWIVAQISFIEK